MPDSLAPSPGTQGGNPGAPDVSRGESATGGLDFQALERSLYKRTPITCQCCGHTKWKTPHVLSRVHIKGLIKCAAAIHRLGRAVNRDDMGLERNLNGNFAALRWWGLISQPKPNHWTITPDGWAFLRHEKWVPRHVWTVDGEVVGVDPETVSIRKSLDEETWQKVEYLARRVSVPLTH